MAERTGPDEPTLIHLVGPFRVVRAGRVLAAGEIGSRKGRLVLQLLAAHRERVVGADEIAEALWPDGPPARVEQNIASLVSRLRALLDADAIEGGRDGYRLAGGSVVVDVDRAARLASEARARLAAAEPALALAAAQRALELLDGEVLEGEPGGPWVDDVRAEVDRTRREARPAAWGAALEVADPETARRIAEAAAREDPLDEEAARAVMTAHRAAGNDAAAMAAFERLRSALADELGTDPSRETLDLHLALLRGEPAAPEAPPAEVGGRVASGDPAFVGRDRELAELSRSWSAAAERRGSFVMLVGEAGIGKSRLAEEAVALAAATGGLVARARCYEAERSLFLQPVSDALRSVALSLAPDALRRAAGAEAGALAEVVPDVAAILRPHGYQPADAEIERRRSFEAVRSFLVALGDHAPVLLYLDDLHNAGTATLELLHFLARRTSRARVAILATVRVEEGDDAIEQLAEVAQRIEVGPLASDAVSELARRMGAAERSERLFAATRGHTLSVVESLRALAERPPGAESGEAELPSTLSDAVRSRVRRLGPEVEEALGVAAVLGATFDPAVAAAMLEVPFEEALRRIEVARRGRLLAVAGDAYSFANDLIREMLYRDMPEPARRARHRRAAALSTGNPEAVAVHATAGADWPVALDAWLQAGLRAASRFANRDAERMFDRALEAATAAGDAHGEAVARLERGRVRELLSDFDGAYRDHVAALAGARDAGDRRLEMQVLRELGSDPLIGMGRPAAECVLHLESALRIAEELDDAGAQANVLSRLAVLSTNRLRFADARDQAGRAVGVARGQGDGEALVRALDGLKTVVAYDGDMAQLEAVTAELEPLARRTGRLLIAHWAVFESAFAPMARGRWPAAVARIRSALEMNRRLGLNPQAAMFLAHLGWIERSQGRYAQAVAVGRQSLVLAEESGHPWWGSFAAVMLGWTLTEVGADGEAVRTLEAGLRLVHGDGAEMYVVRCHAHLALAQAVGGESALAERSLQAAERILSFASRPPTSNFLHGAHATLAAARAALAGGSASRAAVLAGPVLRAAGALGWVEPEAEASLVLASCRVLEGDPAAAERLAEAAASVARAHGLGRLEWEAEAVWSRVMRDLGRTREAEAHLAAALAGAESVASTLTGDDREGFLARATSVVEAAERAAT